MIKRKGKYLVFVVLSLMVIDTGCKETETLPEKSGEEFTVEFDESTVSNDKEDTVDTEKEEFDSKNAYEYARLERILQELKRETDTAQ